MKNVIIIAPPMADIFNRGPAKVRNTALKPAFHAGQNGSKATSAGPLLSSYQRSRLKH